MFSTYKVCDQVADLLDLSQHVDRSSRSQTFSAKKSFRLHRRPGRKPKKVHGLVRGLVESKVENLLLSTVLSKKFDLMEFSFTCVMLW